MYFDGKYWGGGGGGARASSAPIGATAMVFNAELIFEGSMGRLLRALLSIRKEGNVLFNDALDTSYLRLYGVLSITTNTKLLTVIDRRLKQLGCVYRAACLNININNVPN